MTATGTGTPELPPGCEDADPERITPAEPFFPGVTVHLSTGCDGNMGAVMSRVRAALEAADRDEVPDPGAVADWLWARIMGDGLNFSQSLQLVMRTVHVT